jgi:hypothetical protein
MESSDATLYERVDHDLRSHKGLGAQPLLATTSTQAAIHELIARTEGLEEAVREIALEVEKLAATHVHDAPLIERA